MSRQITKVLLFLAGALLMVSTVALAEKAKTINIVADAVLPSGQALKAGKYQVGVNESSNQVTFMKSGKVVATSGFQAVAKPGKNDCNQARYEQKDNKPELQEIRFGGETRSLMLTAGGSSAAATGR